MTDAWSGPWREFPFPVEAGHLLGFLRAIGDDPDAAMLSGIKIDPPLLISGGQYVGGGDVIADIGGIGSLRGDHNVWNAAAACAARCSEGDRALAINRFA